ncbi:MAG: ABC transporter ATP-binding protein [Nocardioides sp.]
MPARKGHLASRIAAQSCIWPSYLKGIDVFDVSHSYSRRAASLALDALTFSVSGSRVALLGPNGAGKSTFVACLVGLINPTVGRIEVTSRQGLRKPIEDLSHSSRVGYLPQLFDAYPRYTCAEFLYYVSWLKNIPPRDIPRQVMHTLRLTNLEAYERRRVGQLSGGERRRLGIAQSVLGEPELLVLDEPTAGLDPQQRSQVLDSLHRQAGGLMIFATHLPQDVAQLADAVVVIGAGQALFAGTPSELAGGGPPTVESIEAGYLRLVSGIER